MSDALTPEQAAMLEADQRTHDMLAAAPPLKVKVYPFREKLGMGNIIWAERNFGTAYYRLSKWAMRGGKFPPGHPFPGDSASDASAQDGRGATLEAFRALGYWASCFPEGDGITWNPLNGQSDEQCMADIKACFGWDATWAVKL